MLNSAIQTSTALSSWDDEQFNAGRRAAKPSAYGRFGRGEFSHSTVEDSNCRSISEQITLPAPGIFRRVISAFKQSV